MKKAFCLSANMALWAAAAILLLACALAACTPLQVAARPPRLIPDSSVDPDLQALADETWRQFLAVFQSRAGCFGDVHLRAAYDLDDRAAYDPATATVAVRVPATAAMLQGGLVHEWAHHLEYQCQAQQELRPAFLAAQELPADTPWRLAAAAAGPPASAWASIPSEQYAEATIELVLGSRSIPTAVRVSPQAVEVIARWADGK